MEIPSEIVEYLQRKFSFGTEQCKFSEISSAYHFNGIVGNSGEISNMVAHPGGMFSFSLFLAFTRNSRKILYHFFYTSFGQCKAIHGNNSGGRE